MIDKILWVVSNYNGPSGAYDSIEDIVAQFSEWWGIEDLTVEKVLDSDWQNDNEITIKSVTYYKNIAQERDNKIEEITN